VPVAIPDGFVGEPTAGGVATGVLWLLDWNGLDFQGMLQ
jgi:hypothetical protein